MFWEDSASTLVFAGLTTSVTVELTTGSMLFGSTTGDAFGSVFLARGSFLLNLGEWVVMEEPTPSLPTSLFSMPIGRFLSSWTSSLYDLLNDFLLLASCKEAMFSNTVISRPDPMTHLSRPGCFASAGSFGFNFVDLVLNRILGSRMLRAGVSDSGSGEAGASVKVHKKDGTG